MIKPKFIAPGSGHVLFFTDFGDVFSTGDNTLGSLGFSSDPLLSEKKPTKIGLLPKIKNISTLWDHSLALTVDGKVYSWGGNYEGGTRNW